MQTKSLEELVRELPPDIQAEVKDFADTKMPLRQDWAGALRNF